MKRLFALAAVSMAALATCAVPVRSNKGGFLGGHVPQSADAPTARDYVQNGLLAMWDGIENAGWGVHDPDATMWKDLVGGYDLILSEAAQVNADNIQTGSSAYAPTFAYSMEKPEGVMSLEVVGYATQKGLYVFLGNSKIRMSISRGTIGCGWWNNGGSVYSYTAGTTVLITCVYSSGPGGELAALYVNGKQLELGTYGLTNNSNGISIGDEAGVISTTSQWNQTVGAFFTIRAYSKKLTPAEVAHNYAIDKVRFNLP